MRLIRKISILLVVFCIVISSDNLCIRAIDNPNEPVPVDVSAMILPYTSVTSYIVDGETQRLTLSFASAPDLSTVSFSYMSSNEDMVLSAELDRANKTLVITPYSEGTTVVTAVINGKPFAVTVTAIRIKINKTSVLLAKGKSSTLKLTGYTGKIKWCSSNKKIAKVSSKGCVKGVKVGNAIVYATVGEKRIGAVVSVVTSKRKKVVNKAISIGKGKYSQPNRMKKGYWDCSALVWRAYSIEKKYFGDKHYAPVAASIAKYLVSKKKKIKGGLSQKNIENLKLRPGDLFFETGAKNGRYKGIYHVEMFVGYDLYGFDANNKPILFTKWATSMRLNMQTSIMARP